MSGWADYGFPDITGVPIQTALEGLAAAADERCYARRGVRPVELYIGGMTVPVSDAMQQVRNCMDVHLSQPDFAGPFLLPDGTEYTPEAAAAYLGEELITLPSWRGSVGYDWSDPFPAIGYDWIMQRYRMLNLLYTIQPLTWNTFLYGNVSGYGPTIAAAMTDANNKYFESVRTGVGQVTALLGRGDYLFGLKFVHLNMYMPLTATYRLYVPAVLTVRTTAGTVDPPGTWGAYPAAFYNFGMRITEGANAFALPGTAPEAFGDAVDVSDWSRQFVSAVRGTSADVLPGASPSCGFVFSVYADLRTSFEFYDPIEGE